MLTVNYRPYTVHYHVPVLHCAANCTQQALGAVSLTLHMLAVYEYVRAHAVLQ